MATKVHIGARIEPELRQIIEEEADRNGLTISEQVSSMLAREEVNGLTDEEVRQIVQEELSQIQAEQPEETDEFEELAMDTMLPKRLRQEVLAMIGDVRYQSELTEDNLLFLPKFLNKLADEVDDASAGPPDRMLEPLEDPQLEEKTLWKVDDIIEEVINEMEEDYSRQSFLTTFAEFLREAAEQHYMEERAIQMSFSKEEWEQLDLMLELLNKNRSESKRFPDLETFFKWKLGKALKEQADEKLFGGYEYPEMAEFGKTLQIMGV